MIRKLLDYLYLKIYENGKFLSQAKKYQMFRNKYSIAKSFRFNGEGILFYGDGDIICEDNSYIGELSTVQASEGCFVKIGRKCSISHNVRIYTQSKISDQDFLKSSEIIRKNVVIEDGVWIGANVFIVPGVKIGENSIIGANSVVTSDVDPYTIMGGVPAKLIRNKKIDD